MKCVLVVDEFGRVAIELGRFSVRLGQPLWGPTECGVDSIGFQYARLLAQVRGCIHEYVCGLAVVAYKP